MTYTVEDALIKLSTAHATPEWVSKAMEELKSLPPALVDPSDVAAAVAPYRWFLARVGAAGPAGLKLTSAGLLRPVDVSAAMAEIGWDNRWVGKFNRELQTPPAGWLRESSMALRLVRTSKGSLLVTKQGTAVKDDPMALWHHITNYLPVDRTDVDMIASVARLLWAATAPADQTQLGKEPIRAAVGAVLSRGNGAPITSADLMWLGDRTDQVMRVLGGTEKRISPTLERALAISCLRGRYGALIATWALDQDLGPDPRATLAAMLERALGAADAPAAQGATASATPTSAATATGDAAPEADVPCHVLKITLRHVEPAVWRRVRVPSSLTLPQVAGVLIAAMGWEGYHLWQFHRGQQSYILPDPNWPNERERDAAKYSLAQLLPNVGDRALFEYDFGDGWEHDLIVEKREPGSSEPGVLAGKRNCPPEDVGGPGGYDEFLEALNDPDHPEHEMMKTWCGGEFDPDDFDVEQYNEWVQGSQYPQLPW